VPAEILYLDTNTGSVRTMPRRSVEPRRSWSSIFHSPFPAKAEPNLARGNDPAVSFIRDWVRR
jgi:hypothetical protein